MRDNMSGFEVDKWKIKIKSKKWISKDKRFKIITDGYSTNDLIQRVRNARIIEPEWYVYPTSVSEWAKKLYNRNQSYKSLLLRNNMGNSWLGKRMALLLNIDPKDEISPPNDRIYTTNEMYMLAPDLIQQVKFNRPDKLLTNFYYPPDDSQRESIFYALESPIRVIQGPPGSGKSKTIIGLIDEFLLRRDKAGYEKTNVLVTTFSYAALNVLVNNLSSSVDKDKNPTIAALAEKIYLMSSYKEPYQPTGIGPTFNVNTLMKKGKGYNYISGSNDFRITPAGTKLDECLKKHNVFFSNAHQLYHLTEEEKGRLILTHEIIEFDLVIVDEASQLPVDHILASMQLLKRDEIILDYGDIKVFDADTIKEIKIQNPENITSHVVIVGDNEQLPPVQPIKPSEKLESILGCVFDYFVKGYGFDSKQLEYNYRSHKLIVAFIESLGFYKKYVPGPASQNKDLLLKGDITKITGKWTIPVLDPNNVVSAIVHDTQFDTSLSLLEVQITTDIIIDIFDMQDRSTIQSQRDFWKEELGIVAPHNAHGRTIINQVFEEMTKQRNLLDNDELLSLLYETIYTVEKFQGSERAVIIASIGISDNDQLGAEESFIYDRNRINVLITRARNKMILICSNNFLNYIPQDKDLFFDVSIGRRYIEYCDNQQIVNYKFNNKDERLQIYYKKNYAQTTKCPN